MGRAGLIVATSKDGFVWAKAAIAVSARQIVSFLGSPVPVEAAKSAVQEWVYRPTLLNSEPIEVIVEVCVPFPIRPPKPRL